VVYSSRNRPLSGSWRVAPSLSLPAGSGKTQLALAEYRATLEAGKRPMYVCFNRPLADHFNRIAPHGGLVCTYHQLCDQRVRHAGETPDFKAPDAFDRLQKRAAELPIGAAFLFDTIIVDEGQDISDKWRDFIFRHARADARVRLAHDAGEVLLEQVLLEETGVEFRHETHRQI